MLSLLAWVSVTKRAGACCAPSMQSCEDSCRLGLRMPWSKLWITRSDGASVFARAREMMAALDLAGDLFKPSVFWRELADENIRMLEAGGIENFKRSLAQNYFNWPIEGPSDPQMRTLLAAWAADPSIVPLRAELYGSAALDSVNNTTFLRTPEAARAYTLFVGLLWWYATRDDAEGLSSRMDEPAIGNPVPIRLEGRPISQDLANSFREYRRFQEYLKQTKDDPRPVLAEIGAGYGRLGYAALRAQPCRYWIFDIPPALAVSEWYLSKVFGKDRVFRWRPFRSWDDVAQQVLAADVALFSIDQLPSIPDQAVQCFATVSAIHEMRPEQIAAFMDLMAKKSASAIYTKNWTRWRNDRDGFDFSSDMLTLPAGWITVFDRVDDVIPSFTEKMLVSSV